jgi:hypothetical protein
MLVLLLLLVCMPLLLLPLSLCMLPCLTLTHTTNCRHINHRYTTVLTLQAGMISQLERNRGELEEQVCATSTCIFKFNHLSLCTVQCLCSSAAMQVLVELQLCLMQILKPSQYLLMHFTTRLRSFHQTVSCSFFETAFVELRAVTATYSNQTSTTTNNAVCTGSSFLPIFFPANWVCAICTW